MDLTRFISLATPLRALGVQVSRNGEVIAQHLWDEDCRRNVYSASKSFTAMAVGLAASEGLLTLDERLVDAFPAILPEQVSDHLAAARVRDLLTMCLGPAEGFLTSGQRPLLQQDDWARAALAQPFTFRPGTRFVYNNVGPYLAGLLVQQRAGCDLVDYLLPRLFLPLGIRRPTWEVDPLGRTFGAGGLMLTLDELHRFGQLCLDGGCWQGAQLVPEDWVMACTSPQADNGSPYGYGYLFWGGPEGSFRADGKYGQFSIILRRHHAVVSMLAECRQADALLRAVFEEIVPQL